MSVLKPGYRGMGWRIYLDGKELGGVFYLDRRRRIIRTFDVVDAGPKGQPAYIVGDPAGPAPHPEWKGEGVYTKEIRYDHRQKIRLESFGVMQRGHFNPAKRWRRYRRNGWPL